MGIYFVQKNTFSVGTISTFLLYANLFSRPIQEMTSILSELQTSYASWRRIDGFINEQEEIQENKVNLSINDFKRKY